MGLTRGTLVSTQLPRPARSPEKMLTFTAESVWKAILWVSAPTVAYIFVGYPILIWGLSCIWPLRTLKRPDTGLVSVVIVGYNEARNLHRKLTSLFNSDDAGRIFEVFVASDGSTDDTAEVVRDFGNARVKYLDFPERRGKPSVLNDVIPQCSSEIVILTDARQQLDQRAVAELAANFADETVGAVSGELVFRSDEDVTTASQGIGAYWRYEKFIRRHESAFRSVPGATGALYAIRRSLYRSIPADTILDDVVIPMQIVAQGRRCLFEMNAVAFDIPTKSASKESVRKRRTIAGAAQMMRNHPQWMLPWRNPIWFEYMSHKIARLASPMLLLAVFMANIALARDGWYLAGIALQITFYLMALIGWVFQRRGRRVACCGVQFMFVSLNISTILALWDAVRGRFNVTWQRKS